MADHTPHQRKIIARYYDHRNEIVLTRLSEIVTELSLADTDRKIDQLWTRAAKAMKTLKVREPVANQILNSRDAEVLARNVRDWLKQAGG